MPACDTLQFLYSAIDTPCLRARLKSGVSKLSFNYMFFHSLQPFSSDKTQATTVRSLYRGVIERSWLSAGGVITCGIVFNPTQIHTEK